MRQLATLSALLILSGAAAQEKTGLAALPTPDGALLRWYLPGDTLPAKGFSLRVTDGNTLKTIPVAAMQPYSSALGITQNDYNGLKNIYSVAPKTNDERTHRALLNLMIISKPAYARALGILTSVTGLSAGQHRATVYALGPKGETKVGEATFTTGPTPPVPPPSALQARGAPPTLKLGWALPKASSTNLVVAYNVYRSTNGAAFAPVNAQPIFPNTQEQAGSYQDEQLSAAAKYTYQVTSVDLFGRESAPTSPVTWTPSNPLGAPVLAQVVAIPGQVHLNWAAIKDSRVKALLVLRGSSPNDLKVIDRLPASGTTYIDRTALPGKTYLYVLSAVADDGTEARSSLYSILTVNTTPPKAPAGLRVTPGENSLTITWDPNTESDIQGYNIYRFADQNSAGAVRLNGDLITTSSFVDPLPQGVQSTYAYSVVAVNTSEVPSARSLPARGELLNKTPPPPPALKGPTIAVGSVVLSWEQADTPDLAGFQIWRSVEGQAAVKLASVDASVRTYEDRSTQVGVSYGYTLKSADTHQNVSAPSNTVRAALPVPIDGGAPQDSRALLLPGTAGVELAWKTQEGKRYVVYRMNSEQPVQISTILKAGTFTDPDGTSSSTYKVRTISSAGTLGDFSPIVTVSATP